MMALEASKQRLAESPIRSADSARAEQEAGLRLNSGLGELRRRAMLEGAGGLDGAPPTTATATPTTPTTPKPSVAPSVTPPMSPSPAIPSTVARPTDGRTGSIGGVPVGDRESVIARVRREAAGSTETRGSVLTRINRERAAVGQKPVEVDWAKDFGEKDIRLGDAATRDKAVAAGAKVTSDAMAEQARRKAAAPVEPMGPPKPRVFTEEEMSALLTPEQAERRAQFRDKMAASEQRLVSAREQSAEAMSPGGMAAAAMRGLRYVDPIRSTVRTVRKAGSLLTR